MKGLKVGLALLLLWLGLCFERQALAQQYNFISYSIEEGLAQSQVQAMYQDQKGYLWIGTYGGVSRFDGLNFTNFSTDDGLLYNQVNAITEDVNGTLWLGSLGGLMQFDGTRFITYPFLENLSDNFIYDLSSSADGGLWLAIERGGLAYFKDGQFKHYHEADGLPHEHIRTLYCDDENLLWFGSRRGLGYLQNGEISIVDHPILATASISDITRDRKGNFWICTFGDGVFRFDGNNFTQYSLPDGMLSNTIRSANEDAQGNLWFSTKAGAIRYDGKQFTNFTQEDGLPDQNLKVMLTDQEGNLWIGTDGAGICRYSGEAFVSFTNKEGLTNNKIMAIAEDHLGNYWFSTYGNGACKYWVDANGEEQVEVFSTENGLPNNTVWSIYHDSKNRMWFGTSGGLAWYEDGAFQTINTTPGQPFRNVKSIFEDQEGKLWFSTTDGVIILEGDSFTYHEEFLGQELINVRDVLEDQNGSIWVATNDGVLQLNGNEVQLYSEAAGLSNDIVYSLELDAQSQLWAATSNGLSFFDGDSIIVLRVGNDFNSNSINFMVADNQNQLWLGTNNGIYQLDIDAFKQSRTAKFVHYTRSDGVTSLECNLNATYLDKQNKLWFGTTAGAIRYDPDKRQGFDTNIPVIHITGLRLLLQKTDWSANAEGISSSTGLPTNLNLYYNQNHLTFDYIGIQLHNPGRVAYQYKLVGFDEDWLPMTNATFATYSNLSDGDYSFVVRASNGVGGWTESPATFSFYIAPPFWKTWWFFTICSLFLIGIGFGLFKWLEGIRKRKKETQQLVYSSRMMKLEQQTLNASMNRHFIFNALNSIQYYINSQDRLAANMYLSNFAELIRKNLDSSQTATVCLAEELERLRLYLTLEHMRFTDKFEYQIDVDRSIDAERVMIPAMLLQPYVENSIWHGILPKAEKGTISISIDRYEQDGISFVIEDDGIGINTSRRNKKDFDQGHISKGMQITEGRINLMQKMSNREVFVKGPYEIHDSGNYPKGTRVEIVLPIDETYQRI
ncbi:MAG: two-component regulator propeller domain-containing protein [Salibacteraceae bacterium]